MVLSLTVAGLSVTSFIVAPSALPPASLPLLSVDSPVRYAGYPNRVRSSFHTLLSSPVNAASLLLTRPRFSTSAPFKYTHTSSNSSVGMSSRPRPFATRLSSVRNFLRDHFDCFGPRGGGADIMFLVGTVHFFGPI
ncbi:hypothetical protein BJ741DRAFT_631496, partial [Chytriomyces cf. hyalinus JEL632]